MTPNYLISLPPSSSSSPLEQLNQDHGAQQHQEEVNKYVPRDEPSDHFFSSAHSPEQSALNYGLELQNCEHDQGLVKEEDKSGCVLTIKWMSSKMRLMKKMMKNDQIVLETPNTISSNVDLDNISSNSSCGDTIVRTCSDCNTTKTPLWRSGPRGPKSLCNACGIRQRKARRALAAAQAEKSGTLVTSETSSTSGTTNKLHIKKKRCKLTARRSKKKLCFEDLVLSVSKNSAYYQVFPQDEKEAAILLMALSCGLAHA